MKALVSRPPIGQDVIGFAIDAVDVGQDRPDVRERADSRAESSFTEKILFSIRAQSVISQLGQIADLIVEFEKAGLEDRGTLGHVREAAEMLRRGERDYRYTNIVPELTRYLYRIRFDLPCGLHEEYVESRKNFFTYVLANLIKELDDIEDCANSAVTNFDNSELEKDLQSVVTTMYETVLNEWSSYLIGESAKLQEARPLDVSVTSLDGKTIAFPKIFESLFGDLLAYSSRYFNKDGSLMARIVETEHSVTFTMEDAGSIERSGEDPFEARDLERGLDQLWQGFETSLSKAVFYTNLFNGRASVNFSENVRTKARLEIPKQWS